MAVEIVDVLAVSLPYTFNTKAYGVIVGIDVGPNGNGVGAVTVKSAAVGAGVSAWGIFQYVDNSALTQTYQSSQSYYQTGRHLLQSGDIISQSGTASMAGMRIVACDTLWEASLFM